MDDSNFISEILETEGEAEGIILNAKVSKKSIIDDAHALAKEISEKAKIQVTADHKSIITAAKVSSDKYLSEQRTSAIAEAEIVYKAANSKRSDAVKNVIERIVKLCADS